MPVENNKLIKLITRITPFEIILLKNILIKNAIEINETYEDSKILLEFSKKVRVDSIIENIRQYSSRIIKIELKFTNLLKAVMFTCSIFVPNLSKICEKIEMYNKSAIRNM
ncbi:MAG: hypothetical protein ACFFBH_11185 [Promethearchaeota archaeon]